MAANSRCDGVTFLQRNNPELQINTAAGQDSD
jgi:hypothetical protein